MNAASIVWVRRGYSTCRVSWMCRSASSSTTCRRVLASSYGGHLNRRGTGFSEMQDGFTDDALNRRETLELVRAYYRITDPAVRKRVFDLIKSMGPSES